MIKLFANNKNFNSLPTVQNEVGTYYYNGKNYYKPVLAEFNNAKLPSGYKKYTDGSHKSYLKERAIDFSQVAGTKVTASEGLLLNQYLYSKAKKKCGIELVYGNLHIIIYHVKCDKPSKYRFKPNEVIATVMTQAENQASGVGAVPPHIHIGTIAVGSYNKTPIRDIILYKEPVVTPPIVETKECVNCGKTFPKSEMVEVIKSGTVFYWCKPCYEQSQKPVEPPEVKPPIVLPPEEIKPPSFLTWLVKLIKRLLGITY
jgi:hypothetical protein